MAANPFAKQPARRASRRPSQPSNPHARRPLPRAQPRPMPKQVQPPRPTGPLFPPQRRPTIPFGQKLPVPIHMQSPMPALKLARFVLRFVPYLGLAMAAYEVYWWLNQAPDPPLSSSCQRVPNALAKRWAWTSQAHGNCAENNETSLYPAWSPTRRYLNYYQPRNASVTWWLGPLIITGPHDRPPDGWEDPIVDGQRPMVELPVIPSVEVPYPYPFAPALTPNIPVPLTRPSEETGPKTRPHPYSPVPFAPPAMPPGEPGPGVSPEPGAPAWPIAPPRPPLISPTPEWPFPELPPESVPSPWPQPNAPNVPNPDAETRPGTGPAPAPIPALDVDINPGSNSPAPAVNPGWHYTRPPRSDEGEKKKRLSNKTSAQWMKFLEATGGNYMEMDDYIAALYKGIPWKYRRWRGTDGVWRDRDITSVSRAQRIQQYLAQYDIEAGLTELAKMYLTDKAFGKAGQALKNKTKELGDLGEWSGARGLGSGTPLNKTQWEAEKAVIREEFNRTYKERTYTRSYKNADGEWQTTKYIRPRKEIPWLRVDNTLHARNGRIRKQLYYNKG